MQHQAPQSIDLRSVVVAESLEKVYGHGAVFDAEGWETRAMAGSRECDARRHLIPSTKLS